MLSNRDSGLWVVSDINDEKPLHYFNSRKAAYEFVNHMSQYGYRIVTKVESEG